MKVIPQSHDILMMTSPLLIEKAGRIAYKSDDRIGTDTKGFIRRLIQRGHESVLEHSMLMVHFVTDRGVTHELVRHRLAGFTQESTRYCNYAKDKFGNEITVIRPWWADMEEKHMSDDILSKWINWRSGCLQAENAYMDAIHMGQSPQDARDLLPTCLKTEIVMTANFREWRHILKLRTARDAHPQMQALMNPLLYELRVHEGVHYIFEDIPYEAERDYRT